MSTTERKNKIQKQEKKILVILSIIFFLKMFSLFMLFPIFSALGQFFTTNSPSLLGLAMGAYGMSAAILQVPFGKGCDRFGEKNMLLFGLFILVLASILGCFATNVYILIIARFLQGCGVTSTPILAFVAKNTRDKVRLKSYGMFGGVIAVSFITAFIASPFLLNTLSLQGLFLILTVLSALALVAATALPQGTRQQTTNKQSVFSLLQRKELLLLAFTSCFLSIGLASVFFSLPHTLTTRHIAQDTWWQYYVPILIGGLLLSCPLLFLAMAKKKFPLVMTIGLVNACFVFILSASLHSHFYLQITLYAFFMASFILFEPLLPALTSFLCPPEMKGTASGVYTLFKFIGMFIGSSVSGLVFAFNYVTTFQFIVSLAYASLALFVIMYKQKFSF